MKHRIRTREHNYSIVLAALMLTIGMGLTFSTSCATSGSATSTQYHSLAAVKVGVDTVMNIWADRVIDGKVTPAQDAQVRAAFKAYQDAFAAAINAAVSDQAPPTALVTQTAGDLLALLASFGVKAGGK